MDDQTFLALQDTLENAINIRGYYEALSVENKRLVLSYVEPK